MATLQEIITADQLLDASATLGRCELIQGELITMSPAGFEHGVIVAFVGSCLADFVRQHALGMVTAAETGFQISHEPDTVRAPDVGFVRAERIPRGRTRGYFQGPPDLAVEVTSPGDRAVEVAAKVQDWLSAGCRVVWVVDPTTQTVSIHRNSAESAILTVADRLTDEALLPGFRLSVADVFAV